MNVNDVISEMHRVREKQAEECGFDPKRIGERMRDRQRERAARGVKYVSFVRAHPADTGTSVVRDQEE